MVVDEVSLFRTDVALDVAHSASCSCPMHLLHSRRLFTGLLAGVLAESIGWPTFFIVSTIAAVPALVLLWWLRASVRALDHNPSTVSVEES